MGYGWQPNCSIGVRMRLLGIVALLAVAAWMGRAQEPEANVNEKYTVESVELSGATSPNSRSRCGGTGAASGAELQPAEARGTEEADP